MSPAVLALALGAFAVGTAEFAAMGMLPWYAADLGLTEPQAGHVVSAYAMGVVVGAPLLTMLGARWGRVAFLIGLIVSFGLLNLAASVAPNAKMLIVLRFLAGLPHGAFLGIGMLYAADTMPLERRARGAAQVIIGLTVANIIGVPAAGWLGQELSWRLGFAIPGVMGLLAGLLMWRVAPPDAGRPKMRARDELMALRSRAVLLVLGIGAIGFGGLFAVYAYLTATIIETSAAPSWVIPVTLALFGVGGTLGTWVTGRLTGANIFKAAAVILALMAAGQIYAGAVVGWWPGMLMTGFIVGGTSSLIIPLQTRMMNIAGRAQNMAASMIHAAFNLANALGPWLAGLALTAGYGWRSPAWVAVGLTLGGAVLLGIAWLEARRMGTVIPAPMRPDR